MATNGNKKENDYVVALDIGTSKVVCLIGQLTDSHAVEIVALGSYPSSGLKKGVVVNIDATTDAIQKSIDQAKNSFVLWFPSKMKFLTIDLRETTCN